MASIVRLPDMETSAPTGSAFELLGWIKTLGRRMATVAAICVDYHAAAGLYEELRGLSDAELRHRGLSRDTLARDICASCDRATRG